MEEDDDIDLTFYALTEDGNNVALYLTAEEACEEIVKRRKKKGSHQYVIERCRGGREFLKRMDSIEEYGEWARHLTAVALMKAL